MGTHDMFVSQVFPAEQSVGSPAVVQAEKQAGTVASQANGLQSVTVPELQLPVPSQKRVDVRPLALEHVALAHITEPSANAHFAEPSHLPVVPQPMLPDGMQVPEGSVVPASTCVQVPSAVGSAQLKHCGQLFEPQHTPSTQWPVSHWSSPAQTLPIILRGTQLPPAQ